MSDTQYVVWFILMAVGIALILGLGTLIMAGVLRRPQRTAQSGSVHRHRQVEESTHHHWYDRFHHAA